MASNSDSSETSFFVKVERKLKKWMGRSGKEVSNVAIASSTKFEDLFPFAKDLPDLREEKFENLTHIWRPKSDLYALTHSPWFSLFFSGFSQVPFLRVVRTSLKVTRFNPIIAVTTTVGFASISGFVILHNQINEIVRGEVFCAECHLVRTGVYQLLCTTLFPSINSVLSSFFSAIHNPGIPIPINTLKNWTALKEALRITGQALNHRKIIATFLAISIVNVAQGVGLVYYAMKQYHDVHARLLKEAEDGVLRPFI